MGKHRFRNRIKSFVGSFIDPDKDEQLKGSYLETEENYKKILEIVKEEDQEDKNKLVELIEEFHNRYKSIYERYDQITGKLKEKVRSKKEKEASSSSSSDSDSDDSSNKESKNGKLNLAENTEIDELQTRLAAETEQKEALNSQLQGTVNMLNESKLQSDQLLEENSKLLAENREVNLKLENTKVVVTELNQEIEDIKKKKTEIETQKDEELLALEKKYEEKIDYLQKELESISTQKQESDSLVEKLLEEKNVHVAEIKQLHNKVDDMSQEIENGLQSKEQMVEQLEETIEDLKSDLEIKGDDVNMLTETVRNLEVKLRLSTQKLRVTEQTLNETEQEHATKEEKLHQENKSLVEKISTLSQTIADIKRVVQDQVNETLTGVDSLTVKFEEDYGHVTTRVNEIRNEILATQIQLKQMKEEEKQKLEEMFSKLKFSETENDRLMTSLEDMKMRSMKKDEKINELENMILVKDEWILSFCEDKREAIKQLCIWADYHKDRFDHLQEQLKTITDSRRQTVR